MKQFVLDLPELPARARTVLAWIVTVASISGLLASGFALHKVGRVATEARVAAAVSCERTKTAAPYSTADSRRRNVYPPVIQNWLEETIPKSCPAVPKSELPPRVTTPWVFKTTP